MSNQDKLFTEELARRNPDWKKIVDAHNDALAAEREKVRTLVDALKTVRLITWEGLKTQERTFKESLECVDKFVESALEKVKEAK